MKETKEHKCKWYKGRISDVTIGSSDKKARCGKCHKVLEDSEINEKVLDLVRIKRKVKGEGSY